MRKKVFISITIVIIIILITYIIMNLIQDKFDYKIEKIEEFNYYTYRDNDKYGVIDKNGEVIIEAIYTSMAIPNPEKDVFVCYDNEDIKIVNSKKEQLYTEYEQVEPIKLKNLASVLIYEKSVLMYKQEGLYGLIDFNGKKITDNIYDSIENLQPTEGKFLVMKDNKYGIIDLNGNMLVDTKYDKIKSDEYYTENEEYKKSGFNVSIKTEDGYRYGYIDYKGQEVLDINYNSIERISKEDDKHIYLIVSENGKYGLYNNSKKVIENEYQSITFDDKDVIILQKNKKYGAATLDGKIIVNIENDEVESRGAYLYVKTSNEKKVYDRQGNILNMNYNRTIYKTENEEYRISTLLNNNIIYYGVIDKNDNQLIEEKYRYIEYLYKNYFIATDDNGKLGVIDSNGKIILEMKYSSTQKIKGKNIIQAISEDNNTSEFYSIDMKEILKISKPNIDIQEDYIIVSNEEQKMYFSNDGEIIKDVSKLKITSFPEEVGEYKKEQISIESVYYTKNSR